VAHRPEHRKDLRQAEPDCFQSENIDQCHLLADHPQAGGQGRQVPFDVPRRAEQQTQNKD
jgi:hypothetical protein